MKERLLVSVLGIPLVLGITFLGGWVYLALVVVALLIGAREFAAIGGLTFPPGLLISAGIIGCCLGAKSGGLDGAGTALFVALFALFCWCVISASRKLDADVLARGTFGMVYLSFLGCFLVLIRVSPTGFRDTILLLAGVWAFDIFSFLVGRKFGRRRLAPRISPKKSVEGLLGGIAATAIVVTLICRLYSIPAGFALPLGLVLSATSQVGDLLESILKRAAGAKDSGGILPGHGGILDRIDGLLISAPAVFFLMRWWTFGAK